MARRDALKFSAIAAAASTRAVRPITKVAPPRKRPGDASPEMPDIWAEALIGEWQVAYRLAYSDDAPVISEIRLFPNPRRNSNAQDPPGQWSGEVLGYLAPCPDGGITARLLRSIPVGRHAAAIRQFDADGLYDTLELKALSKRPAPVQPKSARGRRPLSETFYKRLAEEYKKLCRAGVGNPCKTIAEARGWPSDRVRSAIRRCRQRGLVV